MDRELTTKEQEIMLEKSIDFNRIKTCDFKCFLLEYYQKIEVLEARIKILEDSK